MMLQHGMRTSAPDAPSQNTRRSAHLTVEFLLLFVPVLLVSPGIAADCQRDFAVVSQDARTQVVALSRRAAICLEQGDVKTAEDLQQTALKLLRAVPRVNDTELAAGMDLAA